MCCRRTCNSRIRNTYLEKALFRNKIETDKNLHYNVKNKITGELVWQAERKSSTSTLEPDADNAAGGSHRIRHCTFSGGIVTDVSCFLLLFMRKDVTTASAVSLRRVEGERLGPCITAMGSRVPA